MAVDVGGCASITINLFSVTQTITTILLAVNTPLRRGGRKVERGNNRNRWRIFKATYEEFQVDMVYLLSFGTRRCLGCDMGIIGKILWQESYVKIAWVAIGLGMAKQGLGAWLCYSIFILKTSFLIPKTWLWVPMDRYGPPLCTRTLS